MELLYIWIEKYKNIHRQGFNFSPKHHFEFDFDKEELTHKEKDYNLPNDFFGDNIVNVTGVIGKNGSGKSNLLEFIKDEIFSNHQQEIPFLFCFIFENTIKIYYHHKFTLKIKEANRFKIDKKEFRDITSHEYSTIFQEFPVIYYANIINGKETFHIPDKVIDISVNNYPNGSLQKPTNISLQGNELNLKKSHLIEFQLNLLAETDFEKEITNLISIPDFIKIIFHFDISKIKNILDLPEFCSNPFTHQKSKAFRARFMMFLYINYLEKIYLDKIGSSYDIPKEILEPKSFIEFLNIPDSPKDPKLIQYIKKVEKFISNYEDLISNGYKFSNNKLNNDTLTLSLNKDTISDIIDLFGNNFWELLFPSNNLILDWYYLSSGEEAIFNLFSRFYSIVDKLKSNNQAIIIIDEGELYLHFEWQKKFLTLLYSFFQRVYFNKKLQLFITSHAPFIVSDLPKEHIIFLDKYEVDTTVGNFTRKKGTCKVIKEIDQKETFGANIHTLFTDSFFIQNGLIGEFAKRKIQNVIDYLNDVEKSKIKSNEEAQEIINIVGEPILKNQLQKMLNNKRLEKVEDIDALKEQMKIIEEKIKKFEDDKK
jgi:hypothetical protein